jgi:hypothetical protein
MIMGMVVPRKKFTFKMDFKKKGKPKTVQQQEQNVVSQIRQGKGENKNYLAAFIGKLVHKEMNSISSNESPIGKKDDDNSVKLVNAFDLPT